MEGSFQRKQRACEARRITRPARSYVLGMLRRRQQPRSYGLKTLQKSRALREVLLIRAEI